MRAACAGWGIPIPGPWGLKRVGAARKGCISEPLTGRAAEV